MVPCAFYRQHADSCYPTDPVTPCRYCRVPKIKYIGEPKCPPQTAFPLELRDLYEWRIKPIKKQKYGLGSLYVCMTYSVPADQRKPKVEIAVPQQQQIQTSGFQKCSYSAAVLFLVSLLSVYPLD